MRLFEIKQIHDDNWRLPNDEELRKELNLKLKKPYYYKELGIVKANCWDSWKNIKLSVSKGEITRLPFSNYNSIERLSGGSTLKSMYDMSLSYNSGPRDPFRIAAGFKNNDSIPMPIIIRYANRLILTAGNTRLNCAKICNITPYPKILIIPGII